MEINLNTIIDASIYDREVSHEQDMKDLGYIKTMTKVEAGKEQHMDHVQSIMVKIMKEFIPIVDEAIKGQFIKVGKSSELVRAEEFISKEQMAYITATSMIKAALKGVKKNSLSLQISRICRETMQSNIFNNKKMTAEEKQSSYDKIEDLVKPGMILLEYFLETFAVKDDDYALFVVATVKTTGKKRDEFIIEPTEYLTAKIIQDREELAESLFTNLPMIERPADWTDSGTEGGYYDKQFKRYLSKNHSMKARKDRRNTVLSSDTVKAVNAIQSTPWRVNTFILDTLLKLNETEPETLYKIYPKKLKAYVTKYETDKDVSWESLPEEDVNNLRRQSAERKRHNKKMKANVSIEMDRSQVVRQALYFQKERRIFFPYDVDYRGRIYSMAMSGLNPQGSDLAKAMIQFANGRKIKTESGIKWLKINMANLMGFDKASLVDRVKFTDNNTELIRKVVSDPTTTTEWHLWDKPMQGLACAYEYVQWLDNPDYELHIHMQLDGLCNGVQNLAALTTDEKVAPHLGLIYTEKRGDIYQFVADGVLRTMDSILSNRTEGEEFDMAKSWKDSELVDRSLTKKPVMTRSYAATLFGIKEGVKEYVIDSGKADCFTALIDASNWMGQLIWDTMETELAGPMSVMSYFQDVAKVVGKKDRALEWITPSGNHCYYAPRQQKNKLVQFRAFSRVSSMRMMVTGDKINTKKLTSSIAPNIIHSFDGSHLVLTTCMSLENGVKDFAFVHDSFGTHPDDVETLLECTKMSWIGMYGENQLERMYREWMLFYPECDIPHWSSKVKMGTLNIEDVHHSDYFFA